MSGKARRAREVMRQAVWAVTDGHCFYCRQALTPDSERVFDSIVDMMEMHIDHKVPTTKGGLDALENYVPACAWCNTQKNKRTVEEYRDYLLTLGVVATFMDRPLVARDWLLVGTVRAGTVPQTTISHPHMRRPNA